MTSNPDKAKNAPTANPPTLVVGPTPGHCGSGIPSNKGLTWLYKTANANANLTAFKDLLFAETKLQNDTYLA